MRKTYITNLKLRGFKSFNNHTNLQFGSGFNCIAGANGSGKSNVLDALCFALGRLSTKSIRADNYGDLIYTKNGKKSKGGFVSITFDNKSGIFGIPSSKVELVREITDAGKTKYWLNGKRATRTQVLELLEMSQIRPEGHNIILQGDISSFITMSGKDKRKLIEEIAGIGVYERKKDSALKELGKVEVKLRDVQIVMNEKKTYLNSLESDKKTAEKYQSYLSEEKSAKSTELNLKLNNASKKRQDISTKLKKVEKQRSRFKSQVDDSNKKLEFIEQKIRDVESKIEKKGGEEQLELQKEIENLKFDIENGKSLIKSSNNEIRRIEDRRKQLDKNLSNISGKIKLKDEDLKELRNKLKKLDSKESSIKKNIGVAGLSVDQLEDKIEEKEIELTNLENNKLSYSEERASLKGTLEVLSLKINNLTKTLKEVMILEKQIEKTKDVKTHYKNTIIEINSLSDRDSEIFIEIKEIRKKMLDEESRLNKLQLELNASHEALMRDRAIGAILRYKGKLGEIYGTVAQLGEVDEKYSTALKVAAGGRLKNIVVKDEKVAIKCLNYLRKKRLGVATFLPLNKIKTYSQTSVPKGNGVVGMAHNLVKSESKFGKVFENILGNTIILDDTETAKRLGIGKYQMVTLEGDIFSKSGSISGGYRRETSLSFSKKTNDDDLEDLINNIDKFRTKVKKLEIERDSIDHELIKLRKLKSSIESGIGNLVDPEESSAELKNKLSNLVSDQKKSGERLNFIERDFKKLTENLQKIKIERNSLKSKSKELQFGKQKKELDKIDSERSSLNAEIAALEATIENALSPEKENIAKVVSELQKEKVEFNTQINNEEANVKTKSIRLKNMENEEKEFYGQLKRLFGEKTKLGELIKKEQDKIKDMGMKGIGENEEFNSLNIAKAKIDSELSAIKEEIEPYHKIKTLPFLKTIQAAKQKQSEMRNRLNSLGNVNMKALEIYEEVRKEWEKLNWRVTKLDTERQSIADVINAIENKKTTVFMNTFNKISTNFSRIYSNINNNVVTGNIILENEDNPFDGGVMIKVIKSGTNSLTALSGGEKAMVALSFLFAIAEFNPSPFYLLDEIDAPLDGVNVTKMAELLNDYAKNSQIIIISHKDSVMSSAELLHGVWMNKKHGESHISSMKVK